MRQRTLLFVILALVFSVGTIYLARSFLARQQAPVVAQPAAPVEKPSVAVLVAARDLATGGFIRPEDLRWQVWPEGQVADNYLLKDRDALESLTGAVVRARIAAGEPVSPNRVIKPGDRGFLAAVLTPGMRAITLATNPVSGVAGLVFPGDHVDVILSHQVRIDAAGQQSSGSASETVMTDLRILAMDQSTADADGKPLLAKTVTFEVTPKQVEALEVASTLGNLNLSLRGLASGNSDGEDQTIGEDGAPQNGVRAVSHTWDSDVSALIHHGSGGQANIVTILRGAAAVTVTATPTPTAPAPANANNTPNTPAQAPAKSGT